MRCLGGRQEPQDHEETTAATDGAGAGIAEEAGEGDEAEACFDFLFGG